MSWYEHIIDFSIFTHTHHETFRRLPYGLLLILATNFSNPANFIFVAQVISFYLSICAFYFLSKYLFTYRWLRMLLTTILLFITIALQRLFFHNIELLPQATSSAFIFIGITLALIGFFRLSSNIFILGYLTLGIAVFTMSSLVAVIPVWLIFLCYAYSKSFNLKTIVLSALLLTAPTILYETRAIYLGGKTGYSLSDYLLARVFPLLEDRDVITSDPELNKKIIETLRDYEKNINTPLKGDFYNYYLNLHYDYSTKNHNSWRDLVIRSSGLEEVGYPELLYKKSALVLASRIIRLHLKSYLSMVFKSYVQAFNTLDHYCGVLIEENPELRYLHTRYNEKYLIDSKFIFYPPNAEFSIENPRLSLANSLKAGCNYLPLTKDYGETLIRVIILHLFLIIFIYLISLTDSHKLLIKYPIDLKNCALTYLTLFLTATAQISILAPIHPMFLRHLVTYELLINGALVILLILILFFFLQFLLYLKTYLNNKFQFAKLAK